MRLQTAPALLPLLCVMLCPLPALAQSSPDAVSGAVPSVEPPRQGAQVAPPKGEPASAVAPLPDPEPATQTSNDAPPLNDATELPNETPIESALSPASAMMFRTIGGYGEMILDLPEHAPATIDLRRFVFYFGHHFTESLRFYGELNVEHALSTAGGQGEVEVQQAYIDALLTRRFNVRIGVILMPVGIVNVHHEPPSYNGVERPDVDRLLIPGDWSEAGVGCFGEIVPGLRYQVSAVDGLNANGLAAAAPLENADQNASLANASDLGAVARLDWEPRSGTVLGASGYTATSANSLRQAVNGRVQVSIAEIDARTRVGGFTARAEVALLTIGDTAALNRAFAVGSDTQKAAMPVASQSMGGYLEAGYDVLRVLAPRSQQQLTTFGRLDYLDPQMRVDGGFTARPELRRFTGTLGLTYRPIPFIAFKLDYQRHELGAGPGYNEALSAVTWMF